MAAPPPLSHLYRQAKGPPLLPLLPCLPPFPPVQAHCGKQLALDLAEGGTQPVPVLSVEGGGMGGVSKVWLPAYDSQHVAP